MHYYMADTPGRLRIESPTLKDNEATERRFEEFLKQIPGVMSIKIVPDIGSATILYNTEVLDHKKLIDILDKSGYFDHLQAKTLDDYIEEGTEKILDIALKATTGGISE